MSYQEALLDYKKKVMKIIQKRVRCNLSIYEDSEHDCLTVKMQHCGVYMKKTFLSMSKLMGKWSAEYTAGVCINEFHERLLGKFYVGNGWDITPLLVGRT